MRKYTFCLTVAISTCAPTGALPAEAPKVPAELGQISFLVGDWTCTHAASPDSANPRPGMAATLQIRKAVAAHWIQLSYDASGIHVAGYIGFNTKRKQYVQSMVDSYDDYWTGSSRGWNGDTLTFDDPSTDPGGPSYRDTYVKHSTDEFLHIGEIQGDGGKWKKTDEQTCRRRK